MFSDLEKLARECVVPRLNEHGYYYIDNFLGSVIGNCIFEEVRNLHFVGELRDGQLAGRRTGYSKRHLRGDQIAWIRGIKDNCSAIDFLLSSLDKLIMLCGGKLGHYNIKDRSQEETRTSRCQLLSRNGRRADSCMHHADRFHAMVACYPGNGTGYVRHVDNPTGDGRCVTCIYYLNKNWDAKVDGGILRIVPEGKSYVVDVEPIFDRLLLFWSDRRNPHEVQPTYSVRYAITVWYFDAEERAEARTRYRNRAASEQATTFSS
ncbi:egl nine homolog 3 isoform X3 [Pristis pectinata]|uniref:egl nine homolog 3 isoform X3 n=1 Tax=Pristis pectinata TaxID=685728 RepID=UPI00223E6BA1|nr:egl nine homolog 3 isoform X3 [Pristis pectinata]